VEFASRIGQDAKFRDFAAKVAGERTKINLFYRPTDTIELDDSRQVVTGARFAGEIVPSSGYQPGAMMERVENRRQFFFGPQIP
jgi:hypothetical protein